MLMAGLTEVAAEAARVPLHLIENVNRGTDRSQLMDSINLRSLPSQRRSSALPTKDIGVD